MEARLMRLVNVTDHVAGMGDDTVFRIHVAHSHPSTVPNTYRRISGIGTLSVRIYLGLKPLSSSRPARLDPALMPRWLDGGFIPSNNLPVVCVTLGDQQKNLFFSWRRNGL